MAWTAKELQHWDVYTKVTDSYWIPARPLRHLSIWKRLKDAWLVLTGRYDALDWEEVTK